MRSTIVVVGDILPQNGAKVPLVDNDHVIQALSTERAYYPFGDGVRFGSGLRNSRRSAGREFESHRWLQPTDLALRPHRRWSGGLTTGNAPQTGGKGDGAVELDSPPSPPSRHLNGLLCGDEAVKFGQG